MKAFFILLGVASLAVIAYGAWLIYPPLGYIISGIATLLLAQFGYNCRKKGGR